MFWLKRLNFLEPEQIFVPNKDIKPVKTKALPNDSSLNRYLSFIFDLTFQFRNRYVFVPRFDAHKKEIQKNVQENEDAAKVSADETAGCSLKICFDYLVAILRI